MFTFVTSNKEKIKSAKKVLDRLGIYFDVVDQDLIEIQSKYIQEIALHKAQQAFNQLKSPVVVSDHGWSIPALNGFPGAYMKYINKWFSSNDFLNLMDPYENRTIIKTEVIYYLDSKTIKFFIKNLIGEVLYKQQGNGLAAMNVITLRSNKKSIAECLDEGINSYIGKSVWEEFGEWYKNLPPSLSLSNIP